MSINALRQAAGEPPSDSPASDLFAKFDPLIETREQLLSTGLTDPFGLVMEEVVSPTVAICNGRKTILLGTYNYMGMTFDPGTERHLCRPQGGRGGAQGLLRHGSCHGLFDGLPGQSRDHLDHGGQG
jgi:hypothetical protein